MLPFEILAVGVFEPGWLHARYEPAERSSTPAIEAAIAVEWERQVAEAKRSGRLLFNGELLRYVGHEILADPANAADVFELTVGPTCYRDFVGTNLYNHHRLDEFGWERFANPIGITATLVSGDGLICYGRRSEKVAYHAAHVHTFGGALENADLAADGSVDPFASVCREVHEEVGLRREELSGLCCVGLIRDMEICQPEMLFEARLAMSAAEFRERWRQADDRGEHVEIVTLPNEPDAILPFIKGCGLIAPVAIGALFLHGRRAWGEDWFRKNAELL
jgi:8-oxo-dGTP pyrophosphatase MutT (NUDIX family)